MSNVDLVQDELATLKARADLIGVSYHPSISVAKLREKLATVLQDDVPVVEPDAPTKETVAMRNKRIRDEALKLVRIRLSCMNPAKKEWDGDIYSVGNAIVPTVKKYIPFNNEEGWHVPNIMVEMLAARKCQIFVSTKTRGGVTVRQGKMIKEFAIEILDPLTPTELHELAQRQAMAQSIDA